MHGRGGRSTLVYNGEIFNYLDLKSLLEGRGHRFSSTSDTEVVLAAYDEWGEDFLSHLDGMFALALYDARDAKLLLARDRAGEKPMFYRLAPGEIRFASELKALLADPALPRVVDPAALDCYLGIGFVPGERCILQGFSKLPPAHALAFDLATGNTRHWRYWDIPPPPDAEMDEAALLDELEQTLQSAVRRQLVADVPVGILLSGGVDSSLVTALATRTAPDVRTFTIGFPDQPDMDETAHARLIANHFGTRHVELMAEPATADLLPLLARQFDEPVIDSSMIPTFLVNRLVREHCTVALGGDGGDELFGGYSHYSRMLWLREKTRHVPRPILAAAGHIAGRVLPVGFKGRNWMRALATDMERGVPIIASYFGPSERGTLLKTGRLPGIAERTLQDSIGDERDLLERATRLDFRTYLPEDILVKSDRASMLNSVEVRAPFLDRTMIEFAYGRVPARLKSSPTDRKILLKRLSQRLLPPEFDRKRKQGFSIPMRRWMQEGPFRRFFEETLYDDGCAFDQRTVRRLFQGIDRGHGNGERMFGLVMFEQWRKAYGVTL